MDLLIKPFIDILWNTLISFDWMVKGSFNQSRETNLAIIWLEVHTNINPFLCAMDCMCNGKLITITFERKLWLLIMNYIQTQKYDLRWYDSICVDIINRWYDYICVDIIIKTQTW